jgi:hypothetical protein
MSKVSIELLCVDSAREILPAFLECLGGLDLKIMDSGNSPYFWGNTVIRAYLSISFDVILLGR